MLREIAQRSEQSEPGFAPKLVPWTIWLDPHGGLLGVIPLGDSDSRRNRGRLFPKCPDMTQGELIAGGEIRSHFLIDTVEVVALLTASRVPAPRLLAKHEYFVDLLRQAGSTSPSLAVVARALSDSSMLAAIRSQLSESKAQPADKVTFRVGEDFVVDGDSWHEWWRGWRGRQSSGGPVDASHIRAMRCFVTGELVSPVPTHRKIKGLAALGGQASGDTLISFDKEAFCSYGLKQSANAAVGEYAMTAYVDALNELVRESQYSLAGAKVVYWFDRAVASGEDPLPWLMDSEREEIDALAQARALLESIRSGDAHEIKDNYFYSLLLSGMAGRVMVRDWMYGRFEELADSIWRWFDDLSIVSLRGDGFAGTPGFERVVTSLLPRRKPSQRYDDWIKPIGAQRVEMWRVALRDAPISPGILARLTMLCRTSMFQGDLDPVDISILQMRMGLIKAYHVRKARREGVSMAEHQATLNDDHPSSAYHCGRLLAVLARVQARALGSVGSGVVERYYAAASSTPALVLGRLTRTSQYHLNKLDPGLARWWEERIAAIWVRLGSDVPQTLTLEEQSLFALGYYQQLAEMARKRNAMTDELEES